MNKTFIYRKHIRKMKYFSFVFIAIGIMFILLELSGVINDSDGFGYYLGLFMIVYFGLIGLLIYRMATTEITLTETGIHYKNSSKDFVIRYEDIQEINTAAVRNLGGFFTIVKDKKTKIRITVVLEGIHEFVYLLKEQCDKRELDIYDEQKLFKFYTTAYYSDTSWVRVYSIFVEMVIYFVLMIVLVNLMMIFGENMETQSNFLLVFGGSLIVWAIYYLYYEIGVLAKFINQNTNPSNWELPDVDMDTSKKHVIMTLRILFGFVALMFLVFMI